MCLHCSSCCPSNLPFSLKAKAVAEMFKNTYQSGFLSILYSIGSKPLQIWDKKVRSGHIKRLTDPDIQALAFWVGRPPPSPSLPLRCRHLTPSTPTLLLIQCC